MREPVLWPATSSLTSLVGGKLGRDLAKYSFYIHRHFHHLHRGGKAGNTLSGLIDSGLGERAADWGAKFSTASGRGSMDAGGTREGKCADIERLDTSGADELNMGVLLLTSIHPKTPRRRYTCSSHGPTHSSHRTIRQARNLSPYDQVCFAIYYTYRTAPTVREKLVDSARSLPRPQRRHVARQQLMAEVSLLDLSNWLPFEKIFPYYGLGNVSRPQLHTLRL